MRNTPDSDVDLLIPEGQYDATILKAEDAVSKKGNEMLVVVVHIWGPDGNHVEVTDYLVDTPQMQFKIRHLCESTHVDYATPVLLPEHFTGKPVRVNVGRKVDSYGAKNVIYDYLPRGGEGPVVQMMPAQESDPDLPF